VAPDSNILAEFVLAASGVRYNVSRRFSLATAVTAMAPTSAEASLRFGVC
jgi:hypothetical protein